jgi:hypothetical protein
LRRRGGRYKIMQDPAIEYRSRLQQWQEILKRHQSHARTLSISRLVVFFIGVIFFALSIGSSFFATPWIILTAILFVVLVVKHDQVLRKRDQASMAIQFYERGLSRIQDTWMDRDDPVHEIKVDPDHLYAWDLDVFGPKSLFQLLCTARTLSGIQTLADWLLHPASNAAIRERQAAVDELRERVTLREDLAILESLPSSKKNKSDKESREIDFVLTWAEQSSAALPAYAAAIGVALSILTIASLISWFQFGIGAGWFVIAVFAQSIFASIFRKKIRGSLQGLERAGNELKLLSGILSRLETEQFGSTLLQNWKSDISGEGELPSRRIAKLNRLIEFYDWGRNPYFATFAGLLLWRTQIGFAVEAWRRSNGNLVRKWVIAIGEIEALLSLSCYCYEHPGDPFAQITDEGPVLKAQEVGHPLIPRDRCVRNNFSLSAAPSVLILSGSNMSGKSTFLRTIGINVVLALAGAPVRAESMTVSQVALGVSIRIQDSVQGGYSKFYAEITRIKQIMDLTKTSTPVLFLLDEILHGTNSADRLIGSEAVVRGLQKQNAIGIVTTHDLALAKIVDDFGSAAINMHFEDHIENGKIAFDYKLKPGVIQKSNAIALMRSVGLDV